MHMLTGILAASWEVFQAAAIYMLFGFFLAANLFVFIKPELISRYLGRGKVRSVFLSALLGIPLPLCSCGVVPAAAGLKRQGANSGATLSFLISTPESGVDSIPVTYALLDPVLTVIRPVAAFITAITAGITENFFGKSYSETVQPLPGACCSSAGCLSPQHPAPENISGKNSITEKLKSGFRYAFVDLLGDIGFWFLIGILLAGMISYFLPDYFIQSYLGNGFVAMLVMLAAGIPMYVCATSSTPIAAALVLKGLNPGAALVFLLAGPATNMATLSMVSGLLGKRSLIIYLSAISICSLALGIVTDIIYYTIGITAKASIGHSGELLPHYWAFGGAIILSLLLLYATWKTYKGRKEGACSCQG